MAPMADTPKAATESTRERERQELLAKALSRPGVAEATRVLEHLGQHASPRKARRRATRFATGANA